MTTNKSSNLRKSLSTKESTCDQGWNFGLMPAAAIFYLINILLLPITLIGYVLYVCHLLLWCRPGVSMSAQGPLAARWTQHHLGIREDEAASRLMLALQGFFPFGLYLAGRPMPLAHRLTGYAPKAFRYPYEGEIAVQHQASAPQTFFDAAVERRLANVAQFVILGAGFDTRAYHLSKRPQVRVFEVDTPKTRAVKPQLLKQAGIDTSTVTFVTADF